MLTYAGGACGPSNTARLDGYVPHLTQLSSHSSPHTALLTQLSSHSSPHTALLTQLSSHSSPHTPLLTHLSSHSSPHTALLTQLSSHSSPHTALLTQLSSHTSSTDHRARRFYADVRICQHTFTYVIIRERMLTYAYIYSEYVAVSSHASAAA